MKCPEHQYDKGEHDYSVERSEGETIWIECSVCGRRRDNPYNTVKFYDGEDEIAELSANILHGHGIDQIPSAEKDGCVFIGWYEDEELSTLYDFSQAIYESTNIFAKFVEILEEKKEEIYEDLYITDCTEDVSFVITSAVELNSQNLSDYIDILSINSTIPPLQVIKNGNDYTVKPAEGSAYTFGATYNLTLKSNELYFTDYGKNILSIDFTIIGPETNITYNPDIKYIRYSDVDIIDDDVYFITDLSVDIEVDDILCLWNGQIDEAARFVKVARAALSFNGNSLPYGTLISVVTPELEEVYDDLSFSGVQDVDIDTVLRSMNTGAMVEKIRNSKQMVDLANILADSIVKSDTVNKIWSGADRYFDDFTEDSPNMSSITIRPGDLLPGYAQGSVAAALLKGLTITAKNGKQASNTNFAKFSDRPWIQQTIEINFDATVNRVKINATLTIDIYLYVFVSGRTVMNYVGFIRDEMDFSVNIASQTSVELTVMCCSTSEPDTKTDITKELQDLFKEDGTINDNLISKVQNMLDEDGDYIDLVELNFVHLPFTILSVVNLDVDVSFVVSVNFAAGLTGGVTVLDTQCVGFRGSVKEGFDKYSASPINTYGYESEKTRYEVWAAAYGYVGLKAGVRLEISIYFLGFRDLGRIYASAEVGVYADLYGYMDFYYLQPTKGNVWYEMPAVKSLKGAIYFEFGVYATIKVGADSELFNAKAEATLFDKKWALLSLGNKYTISSVENSDVPVFLTGSEGTNILDDYSVQVLDITTGETKWVSMRESGAIVTAWFGGLYENEIQEGWSYNPETGLFDIPLSKKYYTKDGADRFFKLDSDTGDVTYTKPESYSGYYFHNAYGEVVVTSGVSLACSTMMHITLTMKGTVGDGNSLSFDIPVFWVEEGEDFDFDFASIGQRHKVEYVVEYYDFEGNFEREEVVYSLYQYSTEIIRGYYVQHYSSNYELIEDFDFSLVGTKIDRDLRFVQKVKRRATTIGFAYSLDYNTVNIEPLIYQYGTKGIALPEDIVSELSKMPLFKGFSLYIILDMGNDDSRHVFTFFEDVKDPQNYVLIQGLYGIDTNVDLNSETVQRIRGGEYSKSFDFGSFCSLLKYNLRENINNDDIDLHYYIVAEFDEAGTKDVINFVIPEFEYSIADPYYAGKISEEKTVTTTQFHGMNISFELLGQNMVYVYGSRQDTVESQLEKSLPFGTEIVGWSAEIGGEKICDKYGDLGVLDGDKTFYAIIEYKDISFRIVDHNHLATTKTFKYYDWVGLSDADIPEVISLDGAPITADTDADGTVVMICTGYTLAYGEKKREIGSSYGSKFTVLESGVITPIYERAYKLVINLNGGKVAEEYVGKDLDDDPNTFTCFIPEGEYTADHFTKYFTHDRDNEKGIVYEVGGIVYGGKPAEVIEVSKSVTLDAFYRAYTNLYVQSEYSTVINVYNALLTAGYEVELTNGSKEVVLRQKTLEEVLEAIMAVRSLSVDDPTFVEDSISHEFKGMWEESNGPSGYFLDAIYEADILCYTVIADSTGEARFDDGTTVRSNFYRIDTDLNTVLFRHEWTDHFHLDTLGCSTDYYKIFYGWELPDGKILRNCPSEDLKEGEVNTYIPNTVCTLNVTAKYIDGNRIKYKLRFWSPYGFEGSDQTEIRLEGYYGEAVTGIPTPNVRGFFDSYWGIPVFAGWSVEIPEKFGYNRDLDGKTVLNYPSEGDVYGEIMIRATFTYQPVPVHYYINGELYETIELKHGDELAFPTVNVPKGKVFYGWYTFAGDSLPIYDVSESETVSCLFNYHYYGFMMDEGATLKVKYYVPDLWLEDDYRLLFTDDADFSIISDISQYELCFEPMGYAWGEKYLYADEAHNIYMKVTAVFKEELPEAQLEMHTVDNPTEETQQIKFYLNGKLYQVVQTNDMSDFYRPEVEVPEGKVFIGWFWREYGGPFSVVPEDISSMITDEATPDGIEEEIPEYEISFSNNAIYGFVVDADATFEALIRYETYDSQNDTYDISTQELTLSFADFDSLEDRLSELLEGYDYYVGYYTTTDGEFYAKAEAYRFV